MTVTSTGSALLNMRSNFTRCGDDYGKMPMAEKYKQNWVWNGSVVGIEENKTTQITTQGCRTFCGQGNDYYEWVLVSNTITTWILPIVGIILQAPFVSNAFWETVFSLSRWLGSPMASLSYILWNIKVSGKCALLVDLAVKYDVKVISRDTHFGQIRDAFYLLMTMNQFTIRPHVRQRKEAEGLLRIALFSKDLRLLRADQSPQNCLTRASVDIQQFGHWPASDFAGADARTPRPEDDLEPENYLNSLRQELAQRMRKGRRRGVVPVFISTLWFLFALALSIQNAFGDLGNNAQAHDLAIGLLLTWLPVLILSSIVDRNPVAADATRDELNGLVDRVRLSLMDDTVRHLFLESIVDPLRQSAMRDWVQKVSAACPHLYHFFDKFAGQARRRFHYGAAHPILSDIEGAYIAARGRCWLEHEEEARDRLVLGQPKGLDWLDPRELWQVLGAVMIVGGSLVGAFVLSYFTPTVGLGCRSGGYTVFGTLAFGLLMLEILSWWVLDASKPALEQLGKDIRNKRVHYPGMLARGRSFANLYTGMRDTAGGHSGRVAYRFGHRVSRTLGPYISEKLRVRIEQLPKKTWSAWRDMSAQKRLDHFFFRPMEVFNTAWLIYITMAQTVGAYRNCECMSSLWGSIGGYIDWNNYDTTSSSYVRKYWAAGTILASTSMAVAMVYIMIEWCLQSHMSTASMEDAANGLQWIRRFRWITNPYRMAIHFMIESAYSVRLQTYKSLRWLLRLAPITAPSVPQAGRRSVMWTRDPVEYTPIEDEPIADEGAGGGTLIVGKDPDGLQVVLHESHYDGDLGASSSVSPRTSGEQARRNGEEAGDSSSNLRIPEQRYSDKHQMSNESVV